MNGKKARGLRAAVYGKGAPTRGTKYFCTGPTGKNGIVCDAKRAVYKGLKKKQRKGGQ